MVTLLVIDDDSATRTLTSRYLTQGGYRVISSGTVAGGLQMLSREAVALIVLDLHLPEFNGWDALKLLKADSALRAIPVLVVSNTALPDAQDQVMNLGAAGFIGNPITEQRVLTRVREILGPEAAHA